MWSKFLFESRQIACHAYSSGSQSRWLSFRGKKKFEFPRFPQGHRRQLSMLNIQLSLWKQSTKRRPCCNYNFYNNHINNNYQDCKGFHCKQKITLIARLASPAPNLATSLLLSVLWCKPITLAFTMSWVIINILFFRAIYFYHPLMSSFSWSCLESGPSSGRHGNRTRLPNRSTSTLTTNFIVSEGNLFYVPFQSLFLIYLVTLHCCAILYHLDHLGSVPFCAIWKNWVLSFFVPFCVIWLWGRETQLLLWIWYKSPLFINYKWVKSIQYNLLQTFHPPTSASVSACLASLENSANTEKCHIAFLRWFKILSQWLVLNF